MRQEEYRILMSALVRENMCHKLKNCIAKNRTIEVLDWYPPDVADAPYS